MKNLKCDKNSKHSSIVLQVDNNDTHGLKSGRQVAVRCRNATRRRRSSVKMVAPAYNMHQTRTGPVIRFLSSEVVKLIEIHRRMNVQCGDACLSQQQSVRVD